MEKIALIGFMGAGKSTVGKLLANLLGLRFVEMDDEIVKASNFSSIPEIFKKKGEIFFRELEIKIAKDLSFLQKVVIATGGGVVENKIIIDYFKSKGFILVYLKGSFEVLKQRVKKQGGRPLFEDEDKAKKLYDQRLFLYDRYADFAVEVDNLSPEEVVDKIVKKLNLKVLV